MANGLFYLIAVLVGVFSFALFLLSVAMAFGYLPNPLFDGVTDAAMAVYGVIAAAGAVGAYELSK